MFDLGADLWGILLKFFNLPEIRAFATVLAVASAGVGLWAARKAQRVLHTHEQQILVTHQQSITEQWQRINSAALSNDPLLRTISGLVGLESTEQYRQYLFLQTLVNLLAQAAAARGRETLTEESYTAHFLSVAIFFRNRADLFFAVALDNYYTRSFLDDCKARFAILKPMTKTETGEEVREFAAVLRRLDEAAA